MQQYRKNLGKVSLTAEGAWDGSKAFDILSIVYDENTQHGFISRKEVPVGVDLYNKEYWMPLNVSGYADNNMIILSNKTSDSHIKSYTIEEAINSIAPVGRKPGTILGFYNENSDRLDIGGRWEIWQFNSTTVSEWKDLSNWQNIYYNYNKFVGWYKSESYLKKYFPFPEVGCYAFVGSELNEASVYRCDNKYVWTNTTQHAWDYIKVVVQGNVTVGENGNWFNNGEDTGIPASVKGENGKTPIIRNNNNVLEVSYDNVNWEPISDEIAVWLRVNNNKLEMTKNKSGGWNVISDYIAAWFRWQSDGGEQITSVGKIQITRDGISWTDLSGNFVNHLRISRYIGVNESLPTTGIAEGTIYAKGPYYDEGDTSNSNPIYRLWVYAWKGNTLAWQDNGEFTSIAAGVVQETGDSEKEVMSQKAVTEKLSELGSKVGLNIEKQELSIEGIGGFLDLSKDFVIGDLMSVKLISSSITESLSIRIYTTYKGGNSIKIGTFKNVDETIIAKCESNVDALYFSTDIDITASIEVSCINGALPRIEILEKNTAEQKVENDIAYAKFELKDKHTDTNISSIIGWNELPSYAGRLRNDFIEEVDITDSSYKVIKVSYGDEVTIQTNIKEDALIAVVKDFDFEFNSVFDFATGYDGRVSFTKANKHSFIVPSDGRYIIVACIFAESDKTPYDIQINGRSIKLTNEQRFNAVDKSIMDIPSMTRRRVELNSITWSNIRLYSDGREATSPDWICSNYISINGIDLLRVDVTDNEVFYVVCTYDKNKTLLTRESHYGNTTVQFNANVKHYPNARYVRISSITTDSSIFTVSVDSLSSRFFNRRVLNNKNLKCFAHAGNSIVDSSTVGANYPSSMWGAYINGFDGIHCNVQLTSDNVAYCLHDPTFVDEVTGETIRLNNVTSEVIESCRIAGQPLTKVESVIYLAKMMGMDVCLYNIYGRLDESAYSEVVRLVRKYGMYEHIYWGIPYSDVGMSYLNAVYKMYPKSKILLTQSDLSSSHYSQITEVLQRAIEVLQEKPELEVYLWLISSFTEEDFERVNMEKPYNVKIGCWGIEEDDEVGIFPYVDIYTSKYRPFGISRRNVEVVVTEKYPEFLMGDYGNIV